MAAEKVGRAVRSAPPSPTLDTQPSVSTTLQPTNTRSWPNIMLTPRQPCGRSVFL